VIRTSYNYIIGALGTAATISDTTLNSSAFAVLPTWTVGDNRAMPLTLQNPATGMIEIVWGTAHTAGSSNITVVRGKEGTTAQAWPLNTLIGCNDTLRDQLAYGPSSGRPADPHVGMRWIDTDTKQEVVHTEMAGWQAGAGTARAADLGTRRGGAAIPSGATIIERMGHKTNLSTDATGLVNVVYGVPFPTMTIGAEIHSTNGVQFNGTFTLDAERADGFTAYCWKHDGTAYASGTVSLFYIAKGY
jgi:hypothetical protein